MPQGKDRPKDGRRGDGDREHEKRPQQYRRVQERLASYIQPRRGGVRVRVPTSSVVWKNIIQVVQTAGEPPSRGSASFANIGCTKNRSSALVKMVTENRMITAAGAAPRRSASSPLTNTTARRMRQAVSHAQRLGDLEWPDGDKREPSLADRAPEVRSTSAGSTIRECPMRKLELSLCVFHPCLRKPQNRTRWIFTIESTCSSPSASLRVRASFSPQRH